MVQSIILTGPTAVGKSALAIEIALKCNLEIINADTVCFYKDFDIGSAKPSKAELARVKHHLIDIANPETTYHAGQFLRDVKQVMLDLNARNKRALIVGGSGFYLKALRLGLWDAPETSQEFRTTLEDVPTDVLYTQLLGLDPNHAKKVGPADRYRIIRALEIITLSGKKPSELQSEMKQEVSPSYELWVVDREPDELKARMRSRIEAMIENGLIKEVEKLKIQYPNSKVLASVGYAQVIHYLEGITPAGRKVRPGIPGLVDEIELSHRQLAKAQRTWFKNLQPNEWFTLDAQNPGLTEKLMNFYQ